MSKSLALTTQLIEHRDSGKSRIAVGIIKDEILEITLILTADEARDLAKSLTELARTARGKSIILPGGGQA